MTAELLSLLPSRRGHFLLESGYHAQLWFDLDALFTSPSDIAPLITRLATLLAAHRPTAICGPLLGGAFLAQAIANELDMNFYYSALANERNSNGLFSARYELPLELQKRVRGERVALVDDVISAGSSVRASATALATAGASIVTIGALIVLGTKAAEHFDSIGVPTEALERRNFEAWTPETCPSCLHNEPLKDPVSGQG